MCDKIKNHSLTHNFRFKQLLLISNRKANYPPISDIVMRVLKLSIEVMERELIVNFKRYDKLVIAVSSMTPTWLYIKNELRSTARVNILTS